MATLIVREAKSRSPFRLPHMICLNGRPLGVLGKIGKEALKPQLKFQLFVTFDNPWNIVYEVVSNGAFLIWLIFFYAYNLEKLQFNAIPALFLLNYIW